MEREVDDIEDVSSLSSEVHETSTASCLTSTGAATCTVFGTSGSCSFTGFSVSTCDACDVDWERRIPPVCCWLHRWPCD